MKNRILAATMAASCLSLSAQAQLPIPNEADIDALIRIGGATASDGNIAARFVDPTVCDLSTVVELAATDESLTQGFAFYCELAAGQTLFPDLNAGDLILVQKNAQGGSAQGCGPVADGEPQNFFPLDITAEDCGGSEALAGGGTRYLNCPLTDPQPAVAGFSDIECGLLGATEDQQQNLDTFPGFQVIFGVPVSLNVYRGLQLCQGLPTNDLAENAPSLPSAVINALYTGGIPLWSQIQCDPDGDGTANGDLPDFVAAAGFDALKDEAVYLQRRVESSGTQTFTEIFAVRENCTTGIPTFRTEASCPGDGRDCAGILGGGDFQSARTCCNSGSGDVRAALDACENNDLGCIGVLSLDSLDDGFRDEDETHRFVKIDGVYPSLCNVANGAYRAASLNTAQTVAGLDNPLEPIITSVAAADDVDVANNDLCAVISPNTGVCTGFMADPTLAGNRPVEPVCQEGTGGANDPLLNPTSNFTRASGGAPNNCQLYRNVFTPNGITLGPQTPGGAFQGVRRRLR